jgi:hypothetical protein
MSQELPCKEPDCPEKVYYEREVIPAVAGDLDLVVRGETKTVYLTCARHHTHPYEV